MPAIIDPESLNEHPIADAYPIAKAAIEELASNFLPLVVEQDGTGLEEVHEARMVVKKSSRCRGKKEEGIKGRSVGIWPQG